MDKKINNYTLILYGGGNDVFSIDEIAFGSLKKDATIFFSPSAKESLEKQEEYFNFFRNYANKFGSFKIEKLDLAKDFFDKGIENADMIYFGGGNSFLLNKLINSSGISVFLEKNKKGILLAGYSAGAVIMGKSINPVEYMDEKIYDAPKEGMGFVPWSIFPHYISSDEQTNFLFECAKNGGIPIVAIPNDCGLFCNGDECRVVGQGHIDMFLFNGEIKRFAVGSIISK
ncbi:MAG: Type 1 glutamine amidotransferase-like domain-containing protein [Candidatus Moranbacteria bacterium]|nr:Type 1 glutamine amidotransferase-like domain-containing protein [Candidatus Moranbacteria bacterium]